VVAEIVNAQQGDHSVVFYRDSELAGLVGPYLLGAIDDGGVAVIVATPEHRLWINAWLMQAGLDLGTVTSNGSYIVLDAMQTINRFVRSDWPDAAEFWQTMSPVLTTACRRKRPVRVFGEMVALLWRDGLVEPAVELEALWNEMAKRFTFSLLCAYPHAAVTLAEHSDALAQVCAAHSRASGGDEPG
jgi:hypothetical protein